MTVTHIPSLDEYWAALESAVPEFSAEDGQAFELGKRLNMATFGRGLGRQEG